MSSDPTQLDEALLARRVGEQVKSLRKKSGLSTRALAAAAGISQPFLSQVERGVSTPSMITTYRLAEALGVLPGALLPPTDNQAVTVVRAHEGERLPVAPRPDAAVGRTLLMRPDSTLEIVEYDIRPGEYIEEWFELEGELGLFVVTGRIRVELEGGGVHELGPRDFISHPASIRHRWILDGDEPAHVILSVAHPTRV
ncbi:helix-turn-helix domain-containing protein [Streptomyces acidiscabies]|uniref:helix-turn-helix domain-containing protein n=1 Tax=Streptomyces acidiscabies TaxID=42234 RepID=UPI0038F667DD